MSEHPSVIRRSRELLVRELEEMARDMESYVPPAVCIAIPEDYDRALAQRVWDAKREERLFWASVFRSKIDQAKEG